MSSPVRLLLPIGETRMAIGHGDRSSRIHAGRLYDRSPSAESTMYHASTDFVRRTRIGSRSRTRRIDDLGIVAEIVAFHHGPIIDGYSPVAYRDRTFGSAGSRRTESVGPLFGPKQTEDDVEADTRTMRNVRRLANIARFGHDLIGVSDQYGIGSIAQAFPELVRPR